MYYKIVFGNQSFLNSGWIAVCSYAGNHLQSLFVTSIYRVIYSLENSL